MKRIHPGQGSPVHRVRFRLAIGHPAHVDRCHAIGACARLDQALKTAEEFGVTRSNVDQMKSSTDPFVRRLLGVEGGFGKLMGVDDDWAARAIKAVGNYGEIYDDYFGVRGLKLPRGLNNLWTNGGLFFPLPFR
jgi:general L-amino acid transport system substrate-binding protein